MTEAPDWVVHPTVYSSAVHGDIAATGHNERLPQTKMDQFTQWAANIAGKDALAAGTVPVAGTSVTGTVNATSVGVAPATSVGLKVNNLLVANNFTDPATVVGQKYWSWDDDGHVTVGCAAVYCDGGQNDLVSNEAEVIAFENIEVACQVKWSGLDYTGSDPIVLGVQKYRKGKDKATGYTKYLDVGSVYVDTVAAPAASGDWTELAGTYEVEPGVDQLRFLFHVPSTVTAGTIKFDEASLLHLDLIDDAAVPGLGETTDDIVTRLYGIEGTGFTHNARASALANTAAALVSATARIAALEAEGYTGNVAADDFSWSGEITASANWGGYYTDASMTTGYYSADGNDATWQPPVIGPFTIVQECFFDWQGSDSTSTGDYQLIQTVLSSAPASSAGYRAWLYLFGRVATGFTSWVCASFCSDGTYSVDYKASDTITNMASGTCTVPGLGSVVSFYCGDSVAVAPRNFTLKVGNETIDSFDEAGTGSQLGASNRKWGWGGKAEGGLSLFFFLPTAAVPAKINQWLAADA